MKFKQKKFSTLFTLLFFTFYLVGQISVIPREYVDSLITTSRADSLYYFQSIKISKKALDAATAIDYPRGMFVASTDIGVAYLNANKYDEALNYFFEAKKIGEELDSLSFQAYASYYIGNVYNYLKNETEALKNFKHSYELYQILENPLWQGITLNGIGAVYMKMDKADDALLTFKESLSIFERNGLEAETIIPIGNIGNYYFDEGKTELAEHYLYKCAELLEDYPDSKMETDNYIRLGELMEKQKKFMEVEDYYLKGLNLAEENKFNSLVVLAKEKLASFYEAQGNYGKAFSFIKEAKILNDSLVNLNLTEEITKLQASYDEEQRDFKLLENEKQIAELKTEKSIGLFSTLIALIALIGLGISSYLFFSRNKVKRELIENQLKNETKERELLEKELKNKQQDLTNFALDISRKNQFSQNLYSGLKSIVNSQDSEKAKIKARELLLTTTNHLKINDDIKEFQENVDVVNQEFFNKLGEDFPDLTANERQLCGLIRLNLSTKDIASIRNISPKSIEMGRYRLRKKMNLETGEDITVYLQNF